MRENNEDMNEIRCRIIILCFKMLLNDCDPHCRDSRAESYGVRPRNQELPGTQSLRAYQSHPGAVVVQFPGYFLFLKKPGSI
jgi:hypothetical protein